jgi:hypothetical protein
MWKLCKKRWCKSEVGAGLFICRLLNSQLRATFFNKNLPQKGRGNSAKPEDLHVKQVYKCGISAHM